MPDGLHEFDRDSHPALERIRQVYFWAHLTADFGAGILFVIGSALFFSESTVYQATWMFLIGSILFAVQPTIRLVHELHRRHLVRRLTEAMENVPVAPRG